jgi:hypothetical protein
VCSCLLKENIHFGIRCSWLSWRKFGSHPFVETMHRECKYHFRDNNRFDNSDNECPNCHIVGRQSDCIGNTYNYLKNNLPYNLYICLKCYRFRSIQSQFSTNDILNWSQFACNIH